MKPMREQPTPSPCHCKCGYRCGGPGVCKLPIDKCLATDGHFVKDCGHDFSEWKNTDWGGTAVCSKCGMTEIGHDMKCGP